MTPAGTSNELDVQNGWEENTHTFGLRDEDYNNNNSNNMIRDKVYCLYFDGSRRRVLVASIMGMHTGCESRKKSE